MFDFIKRLLREKSEPLCVPDQLVVRPREEILSTMDYSGFPNPIIVNSQNTISLLVLDDILETDMLYEVDFARILRKKRIDVNERFKIVKVFGVESGFIAHKYMLNNDNRIDYAILDITIGYVIRLDGGEYVEFDGIDVAAEIWHSNPNAKIVFSTAHPMDDRNPSMRVYVDKFNLLFGKHIKDHYINKNSKTRDIDIYDFLYGE